MTSLFDFKKITYGKIHFDFSLFIFKLAKMPIK